MPLGLPSEGDEVDGGGLREGDQEEGERCQEEQQGLQETAPRTQTQEGTRAEGHQARTQEKGPEYVQDGPIVLALRREDRQTQLQCTI